MPKKQPKNYQPDPNYVVKRARSLNVSRVAVAVSCGLDSVAALDVIARADPPFSRVRAFFMYLVPDLSFQERYLQYLERRYSIEIMRLPHWHLSELLKGAYLRYGTPNSMRTKLTKVRDVYAYVRKKLEVDYIATGEKKSDSLERNAQIIQVKGVNEKRRVFWPIGYWSHQDVQSHLDRNGIAPAPDYRIFAENRRYNNFGSLWGEQIYPIKQNYPEDYQKILKYFPHVEGQVVRYEMAMRRGAEVTKTKSKGNR